MSVEYPLIFAAGALMPVFAALARGQPQLRLELSSGLSQAVWQQFQAGELDLALVKQRSGSAAGMACWPEPLAWMDSAQHPCHGLDPLPLVVFPQAGLYRSEMTHALDAAGRRMRLACVTASLASLRAAVEQGLGVTLLPRRLAGPAHRLLDGVTGFAPVPDVEVALHVRARLSAPGRRLAAQLCEACDALLAPQHGSSGEG